MDDAFAVPPPAPPGNDVPAVILREKEPENLESPFSSLDGLLTPNELFYVRSHFATPALDPAHWELAVTGMVERPLRLSLDQLMALPAVTRPVTLECAGNNRIFLVPQAQGAQWGLGAVSTAQWTGVPLSAVLRQAGLKLGAVDVVLQGADEGEAREKPKPPGKLHYARSLPLHRALAEDADSVLLAYRMNGQPLPPSHGFPLRAVVPGWYGMASVKWLTHIHVVDRPFTGYFQSSDYAYWQRLNDLPVRTPITEMFPKASIARPAVLEVVPRSTHYRVHGAAWGGDAPIAKVELSTDGGQTFSAATLLGEALPHCWRRWEFDWSTPPQPQDCTLLARATDTQGRSQPSQRDGDWGSYVIVHMLPIDVHVR